MDSHIFMNQWGSECAPDEYIYQAVAKAHREVHGKEVDVTAISFASDACELVRHGIPALNYGATGRTRQPASSGEGEQASDWNPKQGEHAAIPDLVETTRVYLTLILDTLTRSRRELGLPEVAARPHS
jgi:hypothetical protein